MTRISLLRLALVGTCLLGAAPLIAKTPVPPTPLGSPGDWVRAEDYPAAALRMGMEGQTRFRLTVDPSGRVSACLVVASSGSAVLDEATCRLLTRRALFSPATDRKGKVVSATYSSSIRWQIPQDKANPLPGEVVSSVLVSPEGQPILCQIEKLSGDEANRKDIGPQPCPSTALDHPYTDAQGNPVAKRIRYTIRIEVLDVDPAEVAAAEQTAPKPVPTMPPPPVIVTKKAN